MPASAFEMRAHELLRRGDAARGELRGQQLREHDVELARRDGLGLEARLLEREPDRPARREAIERAALLQTRARGFEGGGLGHGSGSQRGRASADPARVETRRKEREHEQHRLREAGACSTRAAPRGSGRSRRACASATMLSRTPAVTNSAIRPQSRKRFADRRGRRGRAARDAASGRGSGATPTRSSRYADDHGQRLGRVSAQHGSLPIRTSYAP